MTELKSIIEKTGLSFVDADDIRVWMSNRFNGRTPVLNEEILIISENATVKMIDDNYPYLFLIIRHQHN